MDNLKKIKANLYDNLLYVVARPNEVMIKGEGSYLWDNNGKKYLDFTSGWAVNLFGHSSEVITKALCEQSAILVNSSPAYYNLPHLEFADMLVKNSKFQKVFFTSTGAEANEGAIKLARKYGQVKLKGAYEIITLKNSFHGRTLATMSATGKSAFKKLFEPKVPGFHHVEINNLEDLKSKINDKTCAVLIEPIQGEGGVYEVSFDYLKQVRKLCDEKNILMIFDEIQTGYARTGKLFYYEHHGIIPDIITLGKGIGGGYPLAALLCKKELDIFEPGDQGGTYTGQPLSMAVGLAVLTEVLKTRLWENVDKMSKVIIEKLQLLKNGYPVKNIRGRGLLLAFELKGYDIAKFKYICFKNGLLINTPQSETVRFIPSLNIDEKIINEMFELLEISMKEMKK